MALAAWLLIGVLGHASADAGRLAFEEFQYRYETSGVPVVELKLANHGTETANPTVKVTLMEAVSSDQNAYRYRKRGATRPVAVSVAPGETRFVTVPVDKLLASGDYVALVQSDEKGLRSRQRFGFYVSDDEYKQAELSLQTNHLDNFGSQPSRISHKAWLYLWVAIPVAFLSTAVAMLTLRRHSRQEPKDPTNGR